jgi:ATP adenylyltransferase
VEKNVRQGRFDNLLTKGSANEALYNRPLAEFDGCVCAPTLGAIVANWLIIVPRDNVLNFRIWNSKNQLDPQSLVLKLCKRIGLELSEVIWFEHGPSEAGTPVGCGADHAHIHVIFKPAFTFASFMAAAHETSSFDWLTCERAFKYEMLPRTSSYLIAGSGASISWASDVELAGSQFFRRVIANVACQAPLWDYQSHPQHENIKATADTFLALEAAI